jgi:hypothetical protein
MIIFGFFLMVLSARVNDEIKSTCSSDKLRNANRGVLIVGVLLMTVGLCTMIYELNCKCFSGNAVKESTLMTIYSVFTAILGIVCISLGSVISTESNGLCETSSAKNIWIFGILITSGSSLYLASKIYFKLNSTNQKKKQRDASGNLLGGSTKHKVKKSKPDM